MVLLSSGDSRVGPSESVRLCARRRWESGFHYCQRRSNRCRWSYSPSSVLLIQWRNEHIIAINSTVSRCESLGFELKGANQFAPSAFWLIFLGRFPAPVQLEILVLVSSHANPWIHVWVCLHHRSLSKPVNHLMLSLRLDLEVFFMAAMIILFMQGPCTF